MPQAAIQLVDPDGPADDDAAAAVSATASARRTAQARTGMTETPETVDVRFEGEARPRRRVLEARRRRARRSTATTTSR